MFIAGILGNYDFYRSTSSFIWMVWYVLGIRRESAGRAMMTPHYPHHSPTYHKNIHGSVEPRLSPLYHTMIPLLVLTTLVLSAHGQQFPLEVPPPVNPYFDYLRNTTSSNRLANVTREPKYLVEDINFKESQRLNVPEALVDFYDEKKAVRSGRQIVPGVYSCGHQGKDQFINFINPHYPSHDNVAGTCHFRMVTAEPGVCQVRVDFVDTELQSPIEGDCDDQYLIISGSTWSTGFNKLCGINPDQHFYIHLDKHIGFQHVDFTITSVSTNVPYKFGLWITQIDCFDGSSVMAPGGCTQFHFGMEGIIKSFNFEGVQYLNNQNYKSCIRSERGSCFVEFQADANHFMLEPIEVDDYEARKRKKAASTSFFGSAPRSKKKKIYSRPNAKAGDSSCMEDYLLIPGGQDSKEQTEVEHSHDRFCGGFLNAEDDADMSASVYSKVQGNVFWVHLVTGRRGIPGVKDKTTYDQTLHGPGVRVRYSQHLNCIDTDLVN